MDVSINALCPDCGKMVPAHNMEFHQMLGCNRDRRRPAASKNSVTSSALADDDDANEATENNISSSVFADENTNQATENASLAARRRRAGTGGETGRNVSARSTDSSFGPSEDGDAFGSEENRGEDDENKDRTPAKTKPKQQQQLEDVIELLSSEDEGEDEDRKPAARKPAARKSAPTNRSQKQSETIQ